MRSENPSYYALLKRIDSTNRGGSLDTDEAIPESRETVLTKPIDHDSSADAIYQEGISDENSTSVPDWGIPDGIPTLCPVHRRLVGFQIELLLTHSLYRTNIVYVL